MENLFNFDYLRSFSLKKYSRRGLASFFLAIVVVLIVIVDVASVLNLQRDQSAVQNFSMIDPLLTGLAALLTMAGVGLGIAAVVQKKKNRFFGFVGLVFNGLFLLGIGGLYVINAIALVRGGGS